MSNEHNITLTIPDLSTAFSEAIKGKGSSVKTEEVKLDVNIGKIREITRTARRNHERTRIKRFNTVAAMIHTQAQLHNNMVVIKPQDMAFKYMDDEMIAEFEKLHYFVNVVKRDWWHRIVLGDKQVLQYEIMW